MEERPEAGWGAVRAVLAAAAAGLPNQAAPAVFVSGSRPGIPPFGAGTDLVVRCGPAERAELKLTGSPETGRFRWVLHALRYQDRRDREFTARRGWYFSDSRPPVPAAAAGLCGLLLGAHAQARSAGDRRSAALATAGTRPRAEQAEFGGWAGHRLAMATASGEAAFAYVCGGWYLLRGPGAPAGPAPLDPWLDLTGGFYVTDPAAGHALTGHLITVTRPGRERGRRPAEPEL